MRRSHATRGLLLVLLALSASACSDDKKGDGHDHEHGDAEVVQDNDAETLNPKDAGSTDAALRLQNCLEEADQLARPPTGQLPCELVAPGLTL